MLTIILGIAPVFILIGIGYVFFKLKIAQLQWMTVFNQFAYYIGFPFLIFNAITNNDNPLSSFTNTILHNTLYITAITVLSIIIASLLSHDKATKTTIILCLIFNNISFLGFPLLKALYGTSILAEAAIIAACYLFFIFTIGIYFLEKSIASELNWLGLIKKSLFHPMLIAVCMSFIFKEFHLHLPPFLDETAHYLSAGTIPLTLIALGIFMGNIPANELLNNWKTTITLSLITLLIYPALLYIPYLHWHVSKISLMEAAMPIAVTPFVMAEIYHLKKDIIAKTIVVSTLLCPITLIFWYLILQ